MIMKTYSAMTMFQKWCEKDWEEPGLVLDTSLQGGNTYVACSVLWGGTEFPGGMKMERFELSSG